MADLLNTATGEIEENQVDQDAVQSSLPVDAGNGQPDPITTDPITPTPIVPTRATSQLNNLGAGERDGATQFISGSTGAYEDIEGQGQFEKFGKTALRGIGKGVVEAADLGFALLGGAADLAGFEGAGNYLDSMGSRMTDVIDDTLKVHSRQSDETDGLWRNVASWSFLESAMTSVTQFAITGAGTGYLTKLTANAMLLQGAKMGSVAKAGEFNKIIGQSLQKSGRFAGGQAPIFNTTSRLGRALGVNKVSGSSIVNGMANNTVEGVVMSRQLGEDLEAQYSNILNNPFIDEKYKKSIEANIAKAQGRLIALNSLVGVTDILSFSRFTSYAGTKAPTKLRHMVDQANFVAPTEFLQEVTQSMIEQTSEFEAQKGIETEVGKDFREEVGMNGPRAKNELDAPNIATGSDILAFTDPGKAKIFHEKDQMSASDYIMEHAFSTQALTEGLAGLVSGPIRFALMRPFNPLSASYKQTQEDHASNVDFQEDLDNTLSALAVQDFRTESALTDMMEEVQDVYRESTGGKAPVEIMETYVPSAIAARAVRDGKTEMLINNVMQSKDNVTKQERAGQMTREEAEMYNKRLDAIIEAIPKFRKLANYENSGELLQAELLKTSLDATIDSHKDNLFTYAEAFGTPKPLSQEIEETEVDATKIAEEATTKATDQLKQEEVLDKDGNVQTPVMLDNTVSPSVEEQIKEIEANKKEALDNQLKTIGSNSLQRSHPDKDATDLTEVEIKLAERVIEQGIKNGKSASDIMAELTQRRIVAPVGVAAPLVTKYIQNRIDGKTNAKIGESISDEISAEYDAQLAKLPKVQTSELPTESKKAPISDFTLAIDEDTDWQVSILWEAGNNVKTDQTPTEKVRTVLDALLDSGDSDGIELGGTRITSKSTDEEKNTIAASIAAEAGITEADNGANIEYKLTEAIGAPYTADQQKRRGVSNNVQGNVSGNDEVSVEEQETPKDTVGTPTDNLAQEDDELISAPPTPPPGSKKKKTKKTYKKKGWIRTTKEFREALESNKLKIEKAIDENKGDSIQLEVRKRRDILEGYRAYVNDTIEELKSDDYQALAIIDRFEVSKFRGMVAKANSTTRISSLDSMLKTLQEKLAQAKDGVTQARILNTMALVSARKQQVEKTKANKKAKKAPKSKKSNSKNPETGTSKTAADDLGVQAANKVPSNEINKEIKADKHSGNEEGGNPTPKSDTTLETGMNTITASDEAITQQQTVEEIQSMARRAIEEVQNSNDNAELQTQSKKALDAVTELQTYSKTSGNVSNTSSNEELMSSTQDVRYRALAVKAIDAISSVVAVIAKHNPDFMINEDSLAIVMTQIDPNYNPNDPATNKILRDLTALYNNEDPKRTQADTNSVEQAEQERVPIDGNYAYRVNPEEEFDEDADFEALTTKSVRKSATAIAWNEGTLKDFEKYKKGTAIKFRVVSDEEIEEDDMFFVTVPVFDDLGQPIPGQFAIEAMSWAAVKEAAEDYATDDNLGEAELFSVEGQTMESLRPIQVLDEGDTVLGNVHTSQWPDRYLYGRTRGEVTEDTVDEMKEAIVEFRENVRKKAALSQSGEANGVILERANNIVMSDEGTHVYGTSLASAPVIDGMRYYKTGDQIPYNAEVHYSVMSHDSQVLTDMDKILPEGSELLIPTALREKKNVGAPIIIVPIENTKYYIARKLQVSKVDTAAYDSIVNLITNILNGKTVTDNSDLDPAAIATINRQNAYELSRMVGLDGVGSNYNPKLIKMLLHAFTNTAVNPLGTTEYQELRIGVETDVEDKGSLVINLYQGTSQYQIKYTTKKNGIIYQDQGQQKKFGLFVVDRYTGEEIQGSGGVPHIIHIDRLTEEVTPTNMTEVKVFLESMKKSNMEGKDSMPFRNIEHEKVIQDVNTHVPTMIDVNSVEGDESNTKTSISRATGSYVNSVVRQGTKTNLAKPRSIGDGKHSFTVNTIVNISLDENAVSTKKSGNVETAEGSKEEVFEDENKETQETLTEIKEGIQEALSMVDFFAEDGQVSESPNGDVILQTEQKSDLNTAAAGIRQFIENKSVSPANFKRFVRYVYNDLEHLGDDPRVMLLRSVIYDSWTKSPTPSIRYSILNRTTKWLRKGNTSDLSYLVDRATTAINADIKKFNETNKELNTKSMKMPGASSMEIYSPSDDNDAELLTEAKSPRQRMLEMKAKLAEGKKKAPEEAPKPAPKKVKAAKDSTVTKTSNTEAPTNEAQIEGYQKKITALKNKIEKQETRRDEIVARSKDMGDPAVVRVNRAIAVSKSMIVVLEDKIKLNLLGVGTTQSQVVGKPSKKLSPKQPKSVRQGGNSKSVREQYLEETMSTDKISEGVKRTRAKYLASQGFQFVQNILKSYNLKQNKAGSLSDTEVTEVLKSIEGLAKKAFINKGGENLTSKDIEYIYKETTKQYFTQLAAVTEAIKEYKKKLGNSIPQDDYDKLKQLDTVYMDLAETKLKVVSRTVQDATAEEIEYIKASEIITINATTKSDKEKSAAIKKIERKYEKEAKRAEAEGTVSFRQYIESEYTTLVDKGIQRAFVSMGMEKGGFKAQDISATDLVESLSNNLEYSETQEEERVLTSSGNMSSGKFDSAEKSVFEGLTNRARAKLGMLRQVSYDPITGNTDPTVSILGTDKYEDSSLVYYSLLDLFKDRTDNNDKSKITLLADIAAEYKANPRYNSNRFFLVELYEQLTGESDVNNYNEQDTSLLLALMNKEKNYVTQLALIAVDGGYALFERDMGHNNTVAGAMRKVQALIKDIVTEKGDNLKYLATQLNRGGSLVSRTIGSNVNHQLLFFRALVNGGNSAYNEVIDSHINGRHIIPDLNAKDALDVLTSMQKNKSKLRAKIASGNISDEQENRVREDFDLLFRDLEEKLAATIGDRLYNIFNTLGFPMNADMIADITAGLATENFLTVEKGSERVLSQEVDKKGNKKITTASVIRNALLAIEGQGVGKPKTAGKSISQLRSFVSYLLEKGVSSVTTGMTKYGHGVGEANYLDTTLFHRAFRRLRTPQRIKELQTTLYSKGSSILNIIADDNIKLDYKDKLFANPARIGLESSFLSDSKVTDSAFLHDLAMFGSYLASTNSDRTSLENKEGVPGTAYDKITQIIGGKAHSVKVRQGTFGSATFSDKDNPFKIAGLDILATEEDDTGESSYTKEALEYFVDSVIVPEVDRIIKGIGKDVNLDGYASDLIYAFADANVIEEKSTNPTTGEVITTSVTLLDMLEDMNLAELNSMYADPVMKNGKAISTDAKKNRIFQNFKKYMTEVAKEELEYEYQKTMELFEDNKLLVRTKKGELRFSPRVGNIKNFNNILVSVKELTADQYEATINNQYEVLTNLRDTVEESGSIEEVVQDLRAFAKMSAEEQEEEDVVNDLIYGGTVGSAIRRLSELLKKEEVAAAYKEAGLSVYLEEGMDLRRPPQGSTDEEKTQFANSKVNLLAELVKEVGTYSPDLSKIDDENTAISKEDQLKDVYAKARGFVRTGTKLSHNKALAKKNKKLPVSLGFYMNYTAAERAEASTNLANRDVKGDSKLLERTIRNYAYSYMYNMANQQQLIYGDMASFYKEAGVNKSADVRGSEVQGDHRATVQNTKSNAGKRFAAMISGALSGDGEKGFVVLVIDEIRRMTEYYTEENSSETGIDPLRSQIDVIDAGTLATMEARLEQMVLEGTIARSEVPHVRDWWKGTITDKELKVKVNKVSIAKMYAITAKPRYTMNIRHEVKKDGQPTGDFVEATVFIKMGESMLGDDINGRSENSEAGMLNLLAEQVQRNLDGSNPRGLSVRIAPPSAIKTGSVHKDNRIKLSDLEFVLDENGVESTQYDAQGNPSGTRKGIYKLKTADGKHKNLSADNMIEATYEGFGTQVSTNFKEEKMSGDSGQMMNLFLNAIKRDTKMKLFGTSKTVNVRDYFNKIEDMSHNFGLGSFASLFMTAKKDDSADGESAEVEAKISGEVGMNYTSEEMGKMIVSDLQAVYSDVELARIILSSIRTQSKQDPDIINQVKTKWLAIDPVTKKFKQDITQSTSLMEYLDQFRVTLQNMTVKKKRQGFNTPLTPDTYIDLGVNNKHGIVRVAGTELSPTNKLKPAMNGNPAQVILPWNFSYYDEAGNKIKLDMDDYLLEGTGKNGIPKQVDPKKLPAEFLKMISYRTPTQDISMMSSIEVVGFLPPSREVQIIAPAEFVPLMGSDFDIDKLFGYKWATRKVVGKDGKSKLEIITMEDAENDPTLMGHAVANERLRIIYTVLADGGVVAKHGAKQLNGEDAIMSFGDKLFDIVKKGKTRFEFGSFLGYTYQAIKRNFAAGAKDAIGVAAKLARKYAQFRGYDVGLIGYSKKKGYFVTSAELGDVEQLVYSAEDRDGLIMTPEKIEKVYGPIFLEEELAKAKGGNSEIVLSAKQVKKATIDAKDRLELEKSMYNMKDGISAFISVTVDNENLQILHKLMIDKTSYNRIQALMMVGSGMRFKNALAINGMPMYTGEYGNAANVVARLKNHRESFKPDESKVTGDMFSLYKAGAKGYIDEIQMEKDLLILNGKARAFLDGKGGLTEQETTDLIALAGYMTSANTAHSYVSSFDQLINPDSKGYPRDLGKATKLFDKMFDITSTEKGGTMVVNTELWDMVQKVPTLRRNGENFKHYWLRVRDLFSRNKGLSSVINILSENNLDVSGLFKIHSMLLARKYARFKPNLASVSERLSQVLYSRDPKIDAIVKSNDFLKRLTALKNKITFNNEGSGATATDITNAIKYLGTLGNLNGVDMTLLQQDLISYSITATNLAFPESFVPYIDPEEFSARDNHIQLNGQSSELSEKEIEMMAGVLAADQLDKLKEIGAPPTDDEGNELPREVSSTAAVVIEKEPILEDGEDTGEYKIVVTSNITGDTTKIGPQDVKKYKASQSDEQAVIAQALDLTADVIQTQEGKKGEVEAAIGMDNLLAIIERKLSAPSLKAYKKALKAIMPPGIKVITLSNVENSYWQNTTGKINLNIQSLASKEDGEADVIHEVTHAITKQPINGYLQEVAEEKAAEAARLRGVQYKRKSRSAVLNSDKKDIFKELYKVYGKLDNHRRSVLAQMAKSIDELATKDNYGKIEVGEHWLYENSHAGVAQAVEQVFMSGANKSIRQAIRKAMIKEGFDDPGMSSSIQFAYIVGLLDGVPKYSMRRLGTNNPNVATYLKVDGLSQSQLAETFNIADGSFAEVLKTFQKYYDNPDARNNIMSGLKRSHKEMGMTTGQIKEMFSFVYGTSNLHEYESSAWKSATATYTSDEDGGKSIYSPGYQNAAAYRNAQYKSQTEAEGLYGDIINFIKEIIRAIFGTKEGNMIYRDVMYGKMLVRHDGFVTFGPSDNTQNSGSMRYHPTQESLEILKCK